MRMREVEEEYRQEERDVDDEDAINPVSVGEGVPRIPSFKQSSSFPGVHDYPFPPSRSRVPDGEGPP